jgi:hypothetical protein
MRDLINLALVALFAIIAFALPAAAIASPYTVTP